MTLSIGQPVITQSGERGFISSITEADGRTFAIGAAGLSRVSNDVEVITDSQVIKTSDSIVELWASRANGLPTITAEELSERRAVANLATETRNRNWRDRATEEATERAAFLTEAQSKTPANAKAVIVAELVKDQSDSMSDYYGSTSTRTIILGFSTHTRDLFPELRKAALNHAETAFLAAEPANAEHREKYSMGGGFYLKAGYRHANGWRVCKRSLYRGAESVPVGEWSLTPAAATPQNEPAAPIEGATISEHFHTKGGYPIWIVQLGDRVEREEFERLRDAAKALGGWYSRAWSGTPAGFAFKSAAVAGQFVTGTTPAADASTPAPKPERPPVARNSGLASKFRDLADAMQGDIDSKFADRRSKTPRQQRQAAGARLDGYQLQRTQAALRALADHHDVGTVPAALAHVTSKAQVFDLARGEIERSGGYYDAGHETGEPGNKTPAAAALWAMVASVGEKERAEHTLRTKVDGLKLAKIPGYFPTPADVVARMLEAADLPETGRVLEPSAGSGAILDKIKAAAPGCELFAFERHCSLREVLTLKGYSLGGSDFMESDANAKFDRVLMNPPFENLQDIEHVRHAFKHLAPGGRLVAIMSTSPFFRSDRKAQDFREWFDRVGGEREELGAGAFKESGTGVATVIVTIKLTL